MSSWTAGYVSEVDYTHGYYRELSPTLLNFAMLCSQQRHRSGSPRRYLELGFGQGVSLAVHAASTSGEFWGTDFNPVHAANARDLAAASGANVHIFDESFEEFAKRPDLPEFDVITMHGIWSWISDANRRTLVDLIRRKLAVGGVLYVSYNVTPGWSMAMPLRHLLSLYVDNATEKSKPITTRIDAALDFAQSIAGAGSSFFKQNPSLAGRLGEMRKQDHHYLAHEYFNADWHPMAFSEIAEHLYEAKLSYAASANVSELIPSIIMTAESAQLVNSMENPILRETVKDFCTGMQFRKDIWVKGARPLDSFEQNAQLFETRFVLLTTASKVPLKLNTLIGEATLAPEVYTPLIDALSAEGGVPKSLQELSDRLPTISKSSLYHALLILVGFNYAIAVQSEEEIQANRDKCDRYNRKLVESASFTTDVCYLASSVIGGGHPITKLMLWVLREIQNGARNEEQIVEAIWQRLLARNQRMSKDGKVLDTPEENKNQIRQLIVTFNAEVLPTLKTLRIV